MLIRTWYCPRCRNIAEKGIDASGTFTGICDDCRNTLQEKFSELMTGNNQLREELTREYNVKHIEEAYVIQHWGRPRMEEHYYCDTCNRELSGKPPPERTGTRTEIQSFSPVERSAHSCESCRRAYERRREREQRESEREFRKSFFS